MTPSEFLDCISSDLYFVVKDDYVYIMCGYRLGDAKHNYGVCDKILVTDLAEGRFDIESIPSNYINDHFDFMRYDLTDTYGVSKEIVEKLDRNDYSSWYDILIKNGCDPNGGYGNLKEICQSLKDDYSFEGETVSFQGDAFDKECIDKYNKEGDK